MRTVKKIFFRYIDFTAPLTAWAIGICVYFILNIYPHHCWLAIGAFGMTYIGILMVLSGVEERSFQIAEMHRYLKSLGRE